MHTTGYENADHTPAAIHKRESNTPAYLNPPHPFYLTQPFLLCINAVHNYAHTHTNTHTHTHTTHTLHTHTTHTHKHTHTHTTHTSGPLSSPAQLSSTQEHPPTSPSPPSPREKRRHQELPDSSCSTLVPGPNPAPPSPTKD